MFFAGLSAGLLVMYKVIGDTVKVEVKKIKNKRVGSSETTIPIDINTRRLTKERRKVKRALRKNKKI